MDSALNPGLYIVPTPIGNLGDITLRALELLKKCDAIFCEDTRVSTKLLQAYAIQKPLFLYHDHNEADASKKILHKIQEGGAVALISDAGTPLISDPGYKIVQRLRAEQIYITALPGACAAVTALCLSGMPNHRFAFLGFFDSAYVKDFKTTLATLIFYESPNRLLKTLQYLKDHMPNRTVAVVREISKVYEEVIGGTYDDVLKALLKKDVIKGEIVIVLSPALDEVPTLQGLEKEIQHLLKDNSAKDVAEIISTLHNLSKKQAYQMVLKLKNAAAE